jgi:dUTP pyrophosphatase
MDKLSIAECGTGHETLKFFYDSYTFVILPISEAADLYHPGHNSNGDQLDAGIDIVTPIDIVIPPTETAAFKIPLGVKAVCLKEYKINGYYFPITYFLMARSSICKTGLVMANSVGLIDIGYRGELKAPVYNFTKKPIIIKKGTSLFQICTTSGDPPQDYLVLNQTDPKHIKTIRMYFGSADGSIPAPTIRGVEGFGSTGSGGNQTGGGDASDDASPPTTDDL